MKLPLAAIDLGTNTARLLIGATDAAGEISQLHLARRITRLGGDFTRNHGIARGAIERTIDALSEFAADIRRFDAKIVRAVATSAVRDAANRDDFCREIREKTGLSLDVITGREEGMLTLRGVMSGLDARGGDIFVFDVGGGSTEYTLARESSPQFTQSLPLGVVRLTEGKGSVAAMSEKIDRELDRLYDNLDHSGFLARLGDATLVGTAGTATTLAAISIGLEEYDYRLVNNYTLTLGEIARIYERLLPLSPADRLKVSGLETGREDLIIAGILITLRTMERFGFDRLKVSDFGLLEGVLLELAEEHRLDDSPGGVRSGAGKCLDVHDE